MTNIHVHTHTWYRYVHARMCVFDEPQLLPAVLHHLAASSAARPGKSLLDLIPRLCSTLGLISSHGMPLPWGQGCTSCVSQGQDKPACTWSHNPPTWSRTAGKLRTISKHRCAIIMGCLLRYHDGFSFPICQFQNTANGPQRTQAHCQWWILYRGSLHHSGVRLQWRISLTSTGSVWFTEIVLKKKAALRGHHGGMYNDKEPMNATFCFSHMLTCGGSSSTPDQTWLFWAGFYNGGRLTGKRASKR